MIGRIDQHGNTSGLGHQIMEKSQPLGCNLSGEKIDAGRVAARPSKPRDKTQLDRVVDDPEDDRNRCSRSFGRLGSSGLAGRGDNSHATQDKVRHERRQPVISTVQPVVLDYDVLPLHVTRFAESFTERIGTADGVLGRPNDDDTDDRRCLLRARRERPRGRRAAEKGDERSTFHYSITSSARASRLSGTVRPSAFAVLRLITSSYFVGACTGKSAGFSPLRMRST